MTLTMIACADDKLILSVGGSLAYRIPADLQHFKSYTEGKTVLVGRNTYEECSELPNRQWVRLEHATSLETLALAEASDTEFIVGGGATIYKTALPFCDRLLLSRPHVQKNFGRYAAATFFPQEFDQFFVLEKVTRKIGFDLQQWCQRSTAKKYT